MKKCTVEGCDNKYYSKGYCQKHYSQMRKYGKTFNVDFNVNEIIEYEDHIEICLYNKKREEIAKALADLECIDLIKQYKWHLRQDGYVSSSDNIFLHRLIMNCDENMVIDHINHNKLDNRRENLKICTQKENVRNQVIKKTNTSGYTGVYKRGRKWCARIYVDGQQIYLGTFDTFEKAKQARISAEVEYFNK